MVEAIKMNIQKLNGENYHTWKYRMELMLQKDNLWDNISKTTEEANRDAAWKKKDADARVLIALMVEDSQLIHLKKSKTAQEMWENLRSYHQKSTLSNKVQLMRRICNLKLEEGGNIEDHISEMNILFEKLGALDEDKLSDSWTVAMLLSSLPKSYDVLVTALESRPEKDLTTELVTSKMIDEYKRKCSDNNTVLKTFDQERRCFFCKKPDHQKKNCDLYKNWKTKQDKKQNKKRSTDRKLTR